jgi:hypothetical protein
MFLLWLQLPFGWLLGRLCPDLIFFEVPDTYPLYLLILFCQNKGMSRVGRTLFFATLLASLFLLSPNTFGVRSVYALDASYSNCLKDMLDVVAKHPEKFNLVTNIHRYNQAIERRLSEFANKDIPGQFENALNHLHPMNPSFPRDEFLAWYKANPLTTKELNALKAERKTLGDVLHERALAFEKTKESIGFEKATSELNEHLAKLRQICGEDPGCHEKGISEFVNKNKSKLLSCLRADKDTLGSVISGFVISNIGLVASQLGKNQKASDFPYEILANNVIWTPILGEVGCRNKARAAASQVGTEITAPKKVNKFAQFGKAWVSYMWPWSPLNEISYMAFHIGAEKMRGHEVNTDPTHLAKELGMYIVWDTVFAVPRTVLVLDPLYNKKMPATLKPMIDKLVKNKTITEVVYRFGAEAPIKVGVGALNTRIFQWYEKSILSPVVNGKPGAPVSSPAPEPTPEEVTPSIPVAPVVVAKPQIKPAAQQPVGLAPASQKASKQACRELLATYESCIDRCINDNPNGSFDMAAESTLHHTPTCKACVGALDAYEKGCGAYEMFSN